MPVCSSSPVCYSAFELGFIFVKDALSIMYLVWCSLLTNSPTPGYRSLWYKRTYLQRTPCHSNPTPSLLSIHRHSSQHFHLTNKDAERARCALGFAATARSSHFKTETTYAANRRTPHCHSPLLLVLLSSLPKNLRIHPCQQSLSTTKNT